MPVFKKKSPPGSVYRSKKGCYDLERLSGGELTSYLHTQPCPSKEWAEITPPVDIPPEITDEVRSAG